MPRWTRVPYVPWPRRFGPRAVIDRILLAERLSRRRDGLVATSDRRRLRNRSFSLISNDCWGGAVYQRFGLPYTSPFAGLMVMAPDYLALVGDLQTNLAAPMRFTERSRHPSVNARRTTGSLRHDYPIGEISTGIEIHFLHYATAREAESKWRRRAERVDLDRLWVKFDGSKDLAGPHERRTFQAMPFEHKVMFVARPADAADAGGVLVPHWREDATQMVRTGSDAFDIVGWLNGGNGCPGPLRRVALRGA